MQSCFSYLPILTSSLTSRRKKFSHLTKHASPAGACIQCSCGERFCCRIPCRFRVFGQIDGMRLAAITKMIHCLQSRETPLSGRCRVSRIPSSVIYVSKQGSNSTLRRTKSVCCLVALISFDEAAQLRPIGPLVSVWWLSRL